jgi:hypothetical protein
MAYTQDQLEELAQAQGYYGHPWRYVWARWSRRLEIIGDKVNATMQVRHSDDDYNTVSSFRNVSLSAKRSQIQQLGQARRRSWEFLCTDNVPLRIEAAEIEFDIGRMEGQGG